MIIYLYDLIYILPLCVALIRLLAPELEEATALVSVYFAAVFTCLILIVLRHIGKKRAIIVSGVVVMYLLGVGCAIRLELIEYDPDSAMRIFMAVILAVICFAVGRFVIRFGKLKWVFGALIIGALGYCLVLKKSDDKIAVYLLFFMLTVLIVEAVQKWNTQAVIGNLHMDAVFVLPFILILFAGAVFIKTPNEPYDWHHFVNAANGIKRGVQTATQFVEWRFSTQSTFAEVGFSDSAILRAGLIANPSRELKIELTGSKMPNLYLTGKVFDTFDGRNWEATEVKTAANSRMLNTIETMSSLRHYDKENISDYMSRSEVSIEYLTAKTPYVFFPENAVIRDSFLIEEGAKCVGDNLLFDGYNKFRENYDVPYYELNRSSEQFAKYADSTDMFTESDWNNTLDLYKSNHASEYVYSKLINYRKSIYDSYLKETKVSDEVREYLGKYYSPDDSDYTKLAAISKMLSSMKYNSSPGDIPESVDGPEAFLDYFLLEKKEGYCSYFATAFVLLARAEGIPARYVQGFLIPTKDPNVKSYYVMSDMAHAWPEVYFEGKGWIKFEPTPGYEVGYEWSGGPAESESGWANSHNPYEHARNEDIEDTNLPIEAEKSSKINVALVVIPLLLIVTFLVIFMVAGRAIYKVKLSKLSLNEKAVVQSKRNMSILKMMGYSRGEGETLSEFASSLAGKVSDECLEFIESYERVLYSDAAISLEETELIVHNYDMLMRELKAKSKFMYVVTKVIRF